MKFKITEENAGIRADVLLSELENSFSRSYIKKWFKDGEIKVNSKVIKASHILKENDVFEYIVPEKENLELEATKEQLFEIVYDDEDIAIINKPEGVVVHGGVGVEGPTLANSLLGYFGQLSDINGNNRPGIVHRLDKDTTGLMIIAKTNLAHKNLAEMMQERNITKKYLLIAMNNLAEEKLVENYIGKSFSNQIKMVVDGINPKPTKTNFVPLEYFGEIATLVEAELFTGRTHQIRVHANHIGHSIFGDELYNSSMQRIDHILVKKDLDILRKAMKKIHRQALCAYKLSFNHPVTGKPLSFEIEPPKDFKEVIEILREAK